MEIQLTHDGTCATIRLVGRLTVNDEPGRIKKAVANAVGGGAKMVILDLSKVPYIDSTRLGELIASYVTVTRQGGRLILAGAPDRIHDLVTVAGLQHIFEMLPSVEAAQAALKP